MDRAHEDVTLCLTAHFRDAGIRSLPNPRILIEAKAGSLADERTETVAARSHASRHAQENEFRVVIAAPLDLGEAGGWREAGLGGFLHHHQRIGREPLASARRGKRALAEAFSVARIEEGEPEGLERMHLAARGGVAPEDARG